MANILSKTGITTGHSVDAWHITQSIDAFTGDVDYDITVSGSFTLTGSLNIDGDMYGDTLGSSSTSDNTGYANYSNASLSSSYSDFNESDYFTLQLVQPEINLASGASYYVGMGERGPGSEDIGLVLPIDCFIRKIYVSATTQVTGSSESPQVRLLIDGSSSIAIGITLDYSQPYSSGIGSIDVFYTAGTRISLLISTPTFATSPQKVTHNAVLTVLPYDAS
jgi:hypothetical protein